MGEMHDKKNKDYSEADNPYSNFEYVAQMTGLTVQQVLLVQICNKVARMVQLEGREAVNEAIEDSRLDLAVYSTLLYSYYQNGD
jgi:hypothetical protein